MSTVSQLEVLDIRHYNARQLRPLLEHESTVWQQRLSWDYRGSTELLLQYLDSRVLPGFVALEDGKICGYTFCVYEGQKAVVGEAYAAGAVGNSPGEITRTLLIHLLEVLLHAPNISRVESQLLLYDGGSTNTVFTEHGFTAYPRLFMECAIRPGSDAYQRLAAAPHTGFLPANLEIRQWSGTNYQASAELIHDCYIGHIDARINDQYRSLHGSLRFLHNIVRFPGCGIFEEAASWLLVDRDSGRLAGLVLCSRVAAGVAHITQLCIAPQFRGKGLAKPLLRHAMSHLSMLGFHSITLTVTEINHSAVELYRQVGFTTRHSFDAMVLEKPSHSWSGVLERVER